VYSIFNAGVGPDYRLTSPSRGNPLGIGLPQIIGHFPTWN
jgi:hypothetical protein